MSSDEYRPPWLPVNPVPEPAETSENTPEAATDDAETAPSPEPTVPFAPEQPFTQEPAAPFAPEPAAPFAREEPAPFAPTPEEPFTPEASAPSDALEASEAHRNAVEWNALEREVTTDQPPPSPEPSAPPSQEPQQATPYSPFGDSRSPEPRAEPTPFEEPVTPFAPEVAAPAEAPSPFEAPEPESASSPSPSAAAAFFSAQREVAARLDTAGDDSQPREESAQEAPPPQQPPATPMSPYLSGTRPQTDHRDYEPPADTDAQDAWAPTTPVRAPILGAAPTARPDDLTPTKPQMPQSAYTAARPAEAEPGSSPEPEPEPEPSPGARDVPTPIEADEAEIIAPILPPPASEILPRAGEEEHDAGPTESPSTPSRSPGSPDTPDATQFSPAPADSVRQLGASALSNASLQAAGAPTPMGGVPRADDNSDSFPEFGEEEPFVPRFEAPAREDPPQTPSVSFAAPTPRPLPPLSNFDVPETDEPAYTPRVELSASPPDGAGPTRTPLGHESPGEPDAAASTPTPEDPPTPARPWAAVNTNDVEFAAPTILPGVGLEAAKLDGARSDTTSAPTDDSPSRSAEPTSARSPIVPRRAVGDMPSGEVPRADPPEGETPFDVDSSTGTDRDAQDGASGSADEHDVAAASPRRGKRWIWWLILGIVIAAAAGILVYRMFLLPEPITLPVPTITASPAAPVSEPITIEDPSDFVAALPDTVRTDVLVAHESIDPVTEPSLPARVAEHHTLGYGSGPDDGRPDFVVDAYQHYNVDDAQVAYESYAEGATDVEPVLVDDEQVGERALFAKPATSTLVWRNVTAVFVLTGPADEVLDFYEHYGV